MSAYSNFPTVFLMINGYHPFNPDAGIFAGGYQGPLYPNPTSLILQDSVFDSSQYREPHPTPYTMKNTPDFYEGIGIGNPGIDYGNPGHLLGLLDTYCRMSYGLNILKAARDSSTLLAGFGPAVIISIPLLTPFYASAGILDHTNIYPSYSEEPDKYIENFIVGGELAFDPRTDEPFIFTSPYSPSVEKIDFNLLFQNIGLNSYYDLPELFQQYFQDMVDFVSLFQVTNPAGNDVYETIMPDRTEWCVNFLLGDSPSVGSIFNDEYHSLFLFEPTVPSIIGHLDAGVLTRELTLGGTYSRDIYTTKTEVLTREEALLLMTGGEEFHKVNENQYEYRSLTELNSVIDIIPIQTHTFQFEDRFKDIIPPIQPNTGVNAFFSISITDVILNIIGNINIPSITIDGNVRMIKEASSIPGQTGPFFVTAPGNVAIQRNIGVSTSHTNIYSWDKAWFGPGFIEPYNETSYEDQEFTLDVVGGLNISPPISQFDFSHTFDLTPGNNCIRFRLMTQQITTSLVLFETTVIDLNTNIPYLSNHYVIITNQGIDSFPILR